MNILIFTGAGFSFPLGLPTTNGFVQLINRGGQNITNLLNEFLDSQHNDIEYILSSLESFVNDKSFYNYVISKSRLYQTNGNFNNVRNILSGLEFESNNFIKEIKRGIFEILQKFEGEKATAYYTAILKQLQQIHSTSSFSIFTTNYDLTFESAIDDSNEFLKLGIDDFDFGFKTKNSKSIFDKNLNYKWSNKIIEYKKLHGSIDWILDNNGRCLKTGGIAIPFNPEIMPLLYPGYKETPTIEPFKTLHDQLLERLMEADVVYILGFAFRDPYINNLFDTALKIKTDKQFYCINPSKKTELPKESNITIFSKNYSNFHHIEKKVTLDENPLPIGA